MGKHSCDKLRPFWVKKLKERNVCCCIYHVEIQELLVALNNMRTSTGMHVVVGCNCDCKVCSSNEVGCISYLCTYSRTTTLWKAILCLREEFNEWHKQSCLFCECDLCGVETLLVCPFEEDEILERHISWKQFAMETITIQKGETWKKLALIYKSTTSVEFIQYLKPKLEYFIKHNFVARW